MFKFRSLYGSIMHVGGLPWPKGGACTRCRTLLRSLPVGWEVELGDVLDGPAQSVTMLPKSLQVAFSGMLLCSSKELCRSPGDRSRVFLDKGVHETFMASP